MTQPNLALHHEQVRKRVAHGEEYPAQNRLIRIVDQVMYVGAFVGPVFTMPQLLTVWVDRQAAGVNIITWSAYAVAAAGWLYYGVLHKERPIIISNLLWMIMDLLIVIGALLYG